MKKALGLIELVGKAAAIEAMDAALKTADVELVGLENSRGNGRMTVKLEGEVSAIKAAVEAAMNSVGHMGGIVYANKIIPRPSDELGKMLSETRGRQNENSWYAKKVAEVESTEVKKPSCNLCLDPYCPRIRGEAKVKCIHYKDLSRK